MNDDRQKLVDQIANVELPSLWRFALQLTRDKHDALKSWLFRIAHNIWKNELRSRAIRHRGDLQAVNPEGLEEAELGRDTSTPETRLEFQQVVNAVEALPEGQRLVTQLVCVSGFSYAETASILDIAVGTVMSRLARARVAIGEQFIHDEPANSLKNLPETFHATSTNTVRQQ